MQLEKSHSRVRLEKMTSRAIGTSAACSSAWPTPNWAKGDRGVVLAYLRCTSGYSRAQVTNPAPTGSTKN